MGIDLGQRQDYTAIIAVGLNAENKAARQKRAEIRERYGRLWPNGWLSPQEEREREKELASAPEAEPILEVVGIRRFRGVPYTEVVSGIKDLVSTPPIKGAYLAVDATGVGVAVTDMIREAGLTFDAVTITSGGQEVRHDARRYSVPKKDLISPAEIMVEQHKLKIPPTSPDAQILISELLAFRRKQRSSGHMSFEGDPREGEHDDLVLALALAVWKAEKTLLASPTPALSSSSSMFGPLPEISPFGDAPPGYGSNFPPPDYYPPDYP